MLILLAGMPSVSGLTGTVASESKTSLRVKLPFASVLIVGLSEICASEIGAPLSASVTYPSTLP